MQPMPMLAGSSRSLPMVTVAWLIAGIAHSAPSDSRTESLTFFISHLPSGSPSRGSLVGLREDRLDSCRGPGDHAFGTLGELEVWKDAPDGHSQLAHDLFGGGVLAPGRPHEPAGIGLLAGEPLAEL